MFKKAFAKAKNVVRKRLLGAIFDSITLGNCELNLFYNQTIGSEEAVQYAQNKKSSGVNPEDSLLIAKILQFRTATPRVEKPRLRKTSFWDERVILREVVGIGRRDPIVVEHSDTVKTYLVQWNGVKIDLTKLAKLRWIEKLGTAELCNVFGRRRSAIRQSIRTLRNSGFSELNLTKVERNIIESQIKREDRSWGEMREKWLR